MPPPSTSSPPTTAPRPPRRLATATAVLSTLQIVLALTVAAVVQLRLRNRGTCLLGAGGSSVLVGGGAGDAGGNSGAVVVGGVGGLETIPVPSSSYRSSSGSSACSFAYTVSAASIFASFAVSLVRCSGVRAGLWLEGATSAALAGWWSVAAVVFSFDASRASQAG